MLKCGYFSGDNYYSGTQENNQVVIKCETVNSFKNVQKSKISADLQCAKCSDVDGCAVAETCTTASNSMCRDCSQLADASDGAYRYITTQTECKKCGQDCPEGTQVLLSYTTNFVIMLHALVVTDDADSSTPRLKIPPRLAMVQE